MRSVLLVTLLVSVVFLAAAIDKSATGNADSPQAAEALSAQESKLQGDWQAYDFQSNKKTYTMRFEGRKFRAERDDEWYEGHIAIRTEAEPAQLDFAIEDCGCGFKGKTSTGIFYWEGESIVARSPEPGAARPKEFDDSSGAMMRLRRE